MAIGRISGPMLFSNLERQGVDLAFDSNLVYFDVTNRRVGINSTSPQYSIESPGNVKLASILIQGNSISSNTGVINLGGISNISISGGSPNYVIYTDGSGNLSWGQISDLDASWGNLSLANNTISVTNTDGNLILQANGIGSVTTTNDFFAGNVFANNLTGNLNTSSGNVTANLTGNITGTFGNFTGNLYSDWLEGNVVGNRGNFAEVNVISNITLGGTLTANANVVAQKITSPTGDLHISAATDNPNNIIRFDSVSAFDIPSGTTAERPPSPDYGYVRYNTDIGSIEWWGGSQWVAGSNLISTQQIVPDGSSTVFTLNQSTVENAILVNINGTIQQAGAGAYSVSGNQITFAEIPLITDIIEIRFLASGVAALTINFANIASNVSPSANVTYDLGSPNYRWRDLWLSGNTINLGSATLSAVGNTIQLPAGSTVGGANLDATVETINANIVAANVRIAELNANITATNTAIITANTAMKTYVDQGLADALFVAGSYGNVVVAEYLYFDPLINSIRANLGAYQTYANANVVAIQENLGSYQTYANANIGAYQTYANANVVAIQANIGSYQTYANTKIGTNTDSNLVVVSNTNSTSATTGALVVAGGVGINGNINLNGAGLTGNVIDLNNGSIGGINSLYFNDPGVNEGITWIGGNGWFIYESPNSLTNAAGNLQIVRNGIRTLTIDTNGVVTVTNTATSTSATTGALVVAGGIGVGGNINMSTASLLQKGGVNAYVLKNITYLTSGTDATYATPTGVQALKITVVGGGGGAGGVDGSATASTNAYSNGGGGAGYAIAFIAAAEASYTYTVGAGGTGGAAGNNPGAAGGTTEFKNGAETVVISATGGGAGAGDVGATSTGATTGAPGVGSITGLGIPGGIIGSGTGTHANGYGRYINGTIYSLSGSGYCPLIGGGVPSAAAATGINATNYGEGGGPVRTTTAVATNYAGGDGYQGIIIVEEYY
jgi:hypothetical protein